MPRTCSICGHAELAAIDAALVAGEPFRYVSARFGTSTTALFRHKAEHLPAAMVKGKEAREEAHALDIITQLKTINTVTLGILRDARDSGNHTLALRAIERVEHQIQLQAKLLGELDERPQVTINIHPEWVHIRNTILVALESYPDAKRAIVGALNGHLG